MNTPTRRLGRGLGSLIAGGGQGATILTEPPESPEDLVPNTPNLESEAVENNESEKISLISSNLFLFLLANKIFIHFSVRRKLYLPHL